MAKTKQGHKRTASKPKIVQVIRANPTGGFYTESGENTYGGQLIRVVKTPKRKVRRITPRSRKVR
jgi:hypothetical protein